MATVESTTFSFDVFIRPSRHWSQNKCREFVKELRACASTSLNPVPDYQCLSYATNALDDKIIVVVREGDSSGRVIAFASSVFLDMPFLEEYGACTTVLHGGLNCVTPEHRSNNLTVQMGYYAWTYMMSEYPEGFWFTNLAEVISNLGNVGMYTKDCYPRPGASGPLEVQVRIAEEISRRYRSSMAISPDAVFDPKTFVFKGANSSGSCFRKDTEDKRFHHRNIRGTEYFKNLLGRNQGNAVLQVGFLSQEIIVGVITNNTQKFTTQLKSKL